jgi:ABC-type transport system substrate-binding protein
MILSLSLIWAIAGCGSQPEGEEGGEEDTPAAQESKGRIVVGVSDSLESPLPFASDGDQTQIVANATFSKLVSIDSEFAASPGLALSWESSEDSAVWRFFLRDDVVFHSGHPFTADDVAFTFERAGTPGNEGAYFLIPGAEYVESVVVEDDFTVAFHLSGSVADWLLYSDVNIMSRGAVEELGIEYGMRVGSGPFYFVDEEWDHGDTWLLRRFDDYWGDPAPSYEIEFRHIEEPGQLTAALEAGEVDAIFRPDPGDIEKFLNSDAFNIFESAEASGIFLGINTRQEAGGDPDIRRAIAHAVDREAIVNAAYHSGRTGEASFNFVSAASPGHAPVDHISFDIAASRRILGELGFDGDNRLSIDLYTYGDFMPAAEALQAALGESHFAVNLIELSPIGFGFALMQRETWDLYIDQTIFSGGMLGVVQQFLVNESHYNLSGYESEELAALLEQARSAADMDSLISGFAPIQEHIAQSAPLLPLVQPNIFVVGSDRFFGVRIGNRGGTVCFSGAYAAE